MKLKRNQIAVMNIQYKYFPLSRFLDDAVENGVEKGRITFCRIVERWRTKGGREKRRGKGWRRQTLRKRKRGERGRLSTKVIDLSITLSTYTPCFFVKKVV